MINWIENKLQGQGNPYDDLADDFVILIPGAEDNPIFQRFAGVEGFKKLNQLLSEKVSQTFKVTDCIAEENKVVALVHETLTLNTNPDQTYVNRTAWFFVLNDEQKISYFYSYDDTLVTYKALS